MLVKLKKYLKNINYKLFIALLFMGLCPTIYNTLRVFWLGEMPGEYSYSIAGQLSWVNLIYEIINETIILPLFYFMGQALTNKKEFTNRIKTGLVITLIIYLFLSVIVIIFTEPLLRLMATSNEILDLSVKYIRLEAVANIFNIEIVFRDNSEIKMILRSIFLNFIFVTPMIDKDSNIIDVVLFLHDNIRFYLTQPSWIL